MLIDFSASHAVGRPMPLATPALFCPRKDGQFWACAADANPRQSASARNDFIVFLHLGLASKVEVQLLIHTGLQPGGERREKIGGTVLTVSSCSKGCEAVERRLVTFLGETRNR
jgi:hypothetical protein